ncbi:peptidylprolyl isomerase SurA [Vibrio cincinnatiensis]|jgi:peptidyl-prolyl cis-trans isomerase SurA|uniref:peptidylprolyl isomerase SurA n=1 Tax=Vibrio cincinnatiensis TaxID=675 RepID=UPI0012ACC924|nr:peptidylprolyl isomerase SurA [Vibrio cincinnatiensis]MCG3721831.1 peptidylprolyl isomerase SurA [Vibrio cincinnatiensis]MCG3726782.1 peptidylprolyl isomerase SurA [Vibrio cincinnatiensis]MCG3733704.1 peptidylprolyl isomerase SurA [Vibrio cincinnatiensis]MCG3737312.1 peptidylprolyl isomerase SurA [Vibrio cincinnatiensis]MCG3740227.1 peptidylprolyl isomerase SurA [Vibrio cincinnatiensis]
MKLWTPALCTLVTLLGTTSLLAQPIELDRVAIIVNSGVILQSEIDSALLTVKANARQNQQPLPSENILREQVSEKLIIEALQQQEADRIGVRIDDNRLNDAIVEIAHNNQKTPEQLRASIVEEGLTYAEFREQVRKEIAASEARNALVRRRINIIPAEVETLAELLAQETNATVQYKISHIQLRFNEGQEKAQVEELANKLIEELNNGANFSTLALTYSKGPKALQGGDWGWMRKEEMPTIFADQIKMQNKGSIIGPFRSGVGFHILKIDDVKGLETVAVTEVNARHILVKPTIILSDEGAQKQLEEFIRRIHAGEATFAELAQQYSQDPGSAAQNGELGYQTPDLYVPEFKHQVETLAVGSISQPFKTVHGWHIVEVLDRRNVDRTDAALKNRAYRILFNRKFNEEASAWLQELRAAAFVEVLQDTQDDD